MLVASITTMSLARFPSSIENPSLAGPSSSSSYSLSSNSYRISPIHKDNYLSLRNPNHYHFKLLPLTNLPLPRQFVCSCTSSEPPQISEVIEDELSEEERCLREAIYEILLEAGVSELDSPHIASNSPKYAKMLVDGVRDLDELSLWDSWMKEDEITTFSLKGKVKHIAKEKGDNGKIPVLESIGLSLPSSIHLARLLSSQSLPSLIAKVKYVKEIFFSGSDDKKLVGKIARRMMVHLSISVDEDVQQTSSFFEKIEARRGGLDMLGDIDASFRHLIESFPHLLQLSVESSMKPMVKFLENVGVPRQRMGNVLLLFPPILFLDIEKDIKAGLWTFKKGEGFNNDFGRILVKYPWVLSKSMWGNCEEITAFLEAEKVPKVSIDQAIRDWPLLLGCSTNKLKPMLEQFDEVGVTTTKLGKVISTSPQLLLRRPEEFHKVVSFLQDLGFDKESIGGILARCPEIFATSRVNTLQKKVEFLTRLGILKHHLPRVIKKYPELFVSDVDTTLLPRLRYLKRCGLSERDIGSMIRRFSPILGYSIEEVLRPKLEFLVYTMGKPVKDVVEYPRYFSYSLEKKIKPMFFVLKGRNINCSLKDMLAKNDDEFATEYSGIERMLVPMR